MHWIDPNSVPETRGRVARFLVNPHGEVDGLILDKGIEVHLPPHLSPRLRRLVKAGDAVRVRGVRPKGADVLAGLSIEVDGKPRLVDDGPPDHHARHAQREAAAPRTEAAAWEGVVARLLHGPKGEVRGVLFEDGSAVRFAPHLAETLPRRLKVGQTLAAVGPAFEHPLGWVLHAQELAPTGDALVAVDRSGPQDAAD